MAGPPTQAGHDNMYCSCKFVFSLQFTSFPALLRFAYLDGSDVGFTQHPKKGCAHDIYEILEAPAVDVQYCKHSHYGFPGANTYHHQTPFLDG